MINSDVENLQYFDPDNVEDGDNVFLLFEEEVQNFDFSAKPRIGYQTLSVKFNSLAINGVDRSTASFVEVDNDFNINSILEGDL